MTLLLPVPATPAVPALPRTLSRLPRGAAPVCLTLLVVAAVTVPAAVVAAPVVTIGALVAAGVLVLVLTRVSWALLLLVAASPFEQFLDLYVSTSAVKGLGLLVFAAAALHLATRTTGRPAGSRGLLALAALVLLVLASATHHLDGPEGFTTLVRYLSFAATCAVAFLVLQDDGQLRRVSATFVLATGVAAVFALSSLVSGAAARAGGPLDDPNDLAFFFVAALPLAVALAAGQARAARRCWLLAALVLAAGIAGTLSRGASVALVVVLGWAVLRRLVPVRAVVAGLAVLAVAVAALAVGAPSVVATALHQKSYVASRNVDTRALRWGAALRMTADAPLLGLGPAGFRAHYPEYASQTSVDDATDVVAHEMYLEVAAELGLPALVAFLALLAAGARGARRAEDGDEAFLALGVQGALLAACTAALFLTEQYYLPVWLLSAAGLALEARRRTAA
ncbi:MAG: O-antigen polymerase [Frankiales bacterium]|nr:O-antigen polymerase [Frankiales bacterium]